MNFDITGMLHKIFDTESKSSSFQTREFVITTDGTYPQFIKFQLTQDKCGIVDSFKEGEPIKVHFDLRGREWQGKYFTNLNAWKVEKVSGSANVPPADDFPPIGNEPPSFSGFDGPANESFDDLPF